MRFLWSIPTLLITCAYVEGTPSIQLSLNSQVPLVARVGVPYKFTFSSATFMSDSIITYTLSNSPTWLFLDSDTRTLHGTPSSDDGGSSPSINITATDDSGSITMASTLVVRSNPAPVVNIPLKDQLPSLGKYSEPDMLIFYPSAAFNIMYDAETFSQNGSSTGLDFYSVMADNTPLPSWITFDGFSLSFVGSTPDIGDLVEPPQTFSMQLIASDTVGFAGVSIPFDVVVGNHELTFVTPYLTANATANDAFTCDALSESLQLDGAKVNSSDLVSIYTNKPDWLDFNNSTFVLSGVPPASAASTNVSVTVTDLYGDIANATISITIDTSIFSTATPSLVAAKGSFFSYDLAPLFLDPDDVDASVEFTPTVSWLSFNAQNLTVSGLVPSNNDIASIQIKVDATSKTSGASESQTLQLTFTSQSSTSSSGYTSSTISSKLSTSAFMPTKSASTSNSSTLPKSRKPNGGEIAAIVVSVFIVIALLTCLCYCMQSRMRRSRQNKISPASDLSNDESISVGVTSPSTRQSTSVMEKPSLNSVNLNSTLGRFMDDNKRRSRHERGSSWRKSLTLSGISFDTSTERKSLPNCKRLGRSQSDNALSNPENSWVSTQESPYHTMASGLKGRSQSDNELSKATSLSWTSIGESGSGRVQSVSTFSSSGPARNPSRKGFSQNPQRSRDFSARNSRYLKDPSSNVWRSSTSSIQETPEVAYGLDRDSIQNSITRDRSMRTNPRLGIRESRLLRSSISRRLSDVSDHLQPMPSDGKLDFGPSSRRNAGIGHGVPKTADTTVHLGQGVARNSALWSNDKNISREKSLLRQSYISTITESTDVLDSSDLKQKSMRPVPQSPIYRPKSYISVSGNSRRPVSRRHPGSGAFFGDTLSSGSRMSRVSWAGNSIYGRTSTNPRRTTTKSSLERSILNQLRLRTPSSTTDPATYILRDALKISYGDLEDGIGQSQSYVLHRRSSTESTDTSGSRFESAEPSPERPNISTFQSRRDPSSAAHRQTDVKDFQDGVDGAQEQYEESPVVGRAEIWPGLTSNPVPRKSSRRARLMPGAGRRPLSFDGSMKREISHVVCKSDIDSENGNGTGGVGDDEKALL